MITNILKTVSGHELAFYILLFTIFIVVINGLYFIIKAFIANIIEERKKKRT